MVNSLLCIYTYDIYIHMYYIYTYDIYIYIHMYIYIHICNPPMYLISRALKITVEVTLGFRPGIGPGFAEAFDQSFRSLEDLLETRRSSSGILAGTGRYWMVKRFFENPLVDIVRKTVDILIYWCTVIYCDMHVICNDMHLMLSHQW